VPTDAGQAGAPLAAADVFSTRWLRTDVGVLGADALVTRHEGFVSVEALGSPGYWWGNLLVFPDAPADGDLERWTRAWTRVFGERFAHRTFAWERTDGEAGAIGQFEAAGYEAEHCVVLAVAPEGMATPRKPVDHVQVRPLLLPDETRAAIDLAVEAAREFSWFGETRAAFDDHLQEMFARRTRQVSEGGGFWLGAFADGGQLVASLGLLDVGGGLARYQHVDTHPEWRRQGICSRLVHEAAKLGAERLGTRELVIVADRDYHALGLYRGLGFTDVEHCAGVCLRPGVEAGATRPA
jgi:ribosomal protein S18 acetylase RimI-like enzyme